MTPALSSNAQAILLLTAPLIAGRGSTAPDLLSLGEYKRLARHLRDIKSQPADLVSSHSKEILRSCQSVVDESRLKRLLGRGFLLSQVVERWQTRAIWVVSRADADYPRRLKARLREDAPTVLYGCGDIGLLDEGGLAVVGSRDVDDSLISYTMAVGELTARAGRVLISGGAKGVDQAAMRGALEAGGRVSGVLADSLEKTAMNREHRNLLLNGQLVLVSPYDPSAGFNVGNAMQRNKLIYAFSDASLVVNSDLNKGGTWSGAIEQLEKFKFVPVYVRTTGNVPAGLDALRKKGALPWPNPQGLEDFQAVFDASNQTSKPELSLFPEKGGAESFRPSSPESPVSEPPAAAPMRHDPSTIEASDSVISQESSVESLLGNDMESGGVGQTKGEKRLPAETLFDTVREILLQMLTEPMKDSDISAALDVSTAQAKAWLNRLVDMGLVEKKKKPAGYVAKNTRLF